MHWIVQENLFNEFGFNDMIASLEKRNIPHTIVTVIPFVHELEPDIPDPEGPVFVYGSTALSEIAKKRGWYPGTFLNRNFNISIWSERWCGHCLNEDFRTSWFDMLPNDRDLFVRPVDDSKAFSGTVVTVDELTDWKERIRNINDPECLLQSNTTVAYAEPKNIATEWRVFVVDGRVVTVSKYKANDRLDPQAGEWPNIANFVEKMSQWWTPSRAFVMDVADTFDGLKVIEINNFNASGLYACDVDKIVEAVEGMKV